MFIIGMLSMLTTDYYDHGKTSSMEKLTQNLYAD